MKYCIVIVLCILIGPLLSKNIESNVKDDETILFFNTDAQYLKGTNTWQIPVHGWIYEPVDSVVRAKVVEEVISEKYEIEVTEENEALFNRRVNLLLADNERRKSIVIDLCGTETTLKESEANGHFQSIVQLTSEQVSQCSTNHWLEYSTVSKDGRQFYGKVRLVQPRGISVISDIDDTVKVTEVTNRAKLIENTFLKPFQAVDGMAKLYRELHNEYKISVHFVSSSPWQLYPELVSMLNDAEFPASSLSLKFVRFRDTSIMNLFKPGTETKPDQFKAIFNRFPDRQFILIGDSGEQDPEVYGELARQFPERIIAIAIRNISDESLNNQRMRDAFKEIPDSHLVLFSKAKQLKAFLTQKLKP